MEGMIKSLDPSGAVTAITALSDAATALAQAVDDIKHNDLEIREIVTTIVVLAPIAENIMKEAIRSNNEGLNQSFIIVIDDIVRQVNEAKMVVYAWLVKNAPQRLVSAEDMKRALKKAHDNINMRFSQLSQLQINRIDTNVTQAQEAIEKQIVDFTTAIQQLYDLKHVAPRDSTEILAIARAALEREKGFALKGHKDYVRNVAWSPDGRLLATASDDKTAAVWDATSGARLKVLEGHKGSVRNVAWSPDGRLLATASYDRTAAVWDATSGMRLKVLEGHKDDVNNVAWSPDGRLLATASCDKTAAVWDMTSGMRLKVLEGHISVVSNVAWSPDGLHLATASFDRTARIWAAPKPA